MKKLILLVLFSVFTLSLNSQKSFGSEELELNNDFPWQSLNDDHYDVEFDELASRPGRPVPPVSPRPPRYPGPPTRPPRRPTPPPRRPVPPPYDRYICWAVDEYNRYYDEVGNDLRWTQKRAMDNCYRYSFYCYEAGCELY